MSKQIKSIIAVCVAAVLICGTSIEAKTKKIEPSGMPAALRDSLTVKYPGAVLQNVERVKKNGSVKYKIDLLDGKTPMTVEYDEEGNLIARDATLLNSLGDIFKRKSAKQSKKSNRGNPTVYGYTQFFYRHAFDTGIDSLVDNDNFRVMRLRLGVKGDISPLLAYEIEIDPRAPEVTGFLRDAIIDVKFTKDQKLRLGQQKTQFGYENRESSTELYTVNRAEVSDALSRGINLRDIGIGLIGKIRLNEKLNFENAITVVNGAGMNQQNDDTPQKNTWGRLGLRYKNSEYWTRVGFSGGIGDYIDLGDPLDPDDDLLVKFKRVGVDFETDQKWFFLSTEYVSGDDEVNGESGTANGWYVNLAAKTSTRLGPLLRYDTFNEDFVRYTFGIYYGELKDDFRVLLNYEYRESFEDNSGNVGRGDDKFYIWTQLRF